MNIIGLVGGVITVLWILINIFKLLFRSNTYICPHKKGIEGRLITMESKILDIEHDVKTNKNEILEQKNIHINILSELKNINIRLFQGNGTKSLCSRIDILEEKIKQIKGE